MATKPRAKSAAANRRATTRSIIAMTAEAMAGTREHCLAAGMDDYIAKPIRLEDMSAIVNKCLQATTPDAPAI